ncbi:MAG: transporter [Gemmatimonadota bacterium]|nr:transporter [Gemmatimonadota bacterium]
MTRGTTRLELRPRRGGRHRAGPLCFVVAVVVVLGCLPAGAAAPSEDPWYAGRLRFATGFDYRSGDYGSDFGKTNLLAVPVSLEYRFERLQFSPGDRFRIRVTVPYLRVDGPFRGEASATGGTGVDEGVGDTYLRLSYFYFPPSPKWPFLGFGGRIKFPTADEDKNLGTGEFDYTLETMVSQKFRLGSYVLTPYATVGYKFVGEPKGEDRNNSWRAGTGFSFRIDRRWTVGARYSFRESSIPGRGPRHVVGPFVNVRITDYLSVLPYAVAGLSKESPDWAVGLEFRWDTFFR